MIGGFWRINPSSRASIYIRNGLDNSPLTVTPIVYLSNGARYSLSPVTLRPLGTAVVSINKSLEAQGIAPYAELSGYVEVEYSWAWDALCVSVSSFDPVHSLIFTYSLQPAAIPDTPTPLTRLKAAGGMNMIESLWWKPTPGATGFVAISNTAEQTSTATLQLTGGAGQILEEETAQISPHGTKIINLQALQTVSSGATGGLHILYSGQAENTVMSGGLEDDQTGYSANLPFHAFASPQADPSQASEESYAELGLMTGEADPMMHFPSGTVFMPFSAVRNVGQQTLTVTPSFYWMQAGQPRSAALDSFAIAPSQTLNLDIPALLSKAGLAQWSGAVNLILDAKGSSRSLLLAAGSVDTKNTYVFQVMPQGIQDSQAKSISYWSTANGDDTMITVWNPADEPQDFLLTFDFESGHYRLPVHLGPRATQTLNISDLIKSNLPDDEGNTIPASVTEGSATLSGSQAGNQEILAALDAGTYNVNKAICRYYCISCDGTIHVYVAANPFAVAQGGQNQLTLMAQQHSGGTYSIGASWSSNHTNIATVSSSSGLVTGVSVGAVTMTANATHTPWYNSYYCAYDPFCPYYGSGGGSSGGYVGPYRVEPIATPSQGAAVCPAGMAGWSRNVTAQLQYYDGSGYRLSGIVMADNLQVTGTNQLGITNSQTGSFPTDSNGSWPDTYYVCSTACPSTGESDSIQYWTYSSLPLPHTNLVAYKCSSIAIDGY
jgi:hypothetical protein